MEQLIKRYKWWLLGLIVLGLLALVFDRWLDYRQSRQDEFIVAAAEKYGVSPALVKAVVWRESRFNPRAHGKAGEVGLMQIAKLAAQEYAETERIAPFQLRQLYDPEQNTLAGTWYLRKLLRRYAHTDNPLPYALADYNAGRSNVLRWNRGQAATQSRVFLTRIDFPTTKDYVISVMKRYEHYQASLKSSGT